MAKKNEKKTYKSKDFDMLNESFTKKTQKRQQKPENTDDGEIIKLVAEIQATKKMKQENDSDEVCKASNHKLIEVMEKQLAARKQVSDKVLRSLSEVISLLESDYNVLTDNEQKFELLVSSFLKTIQQATAATKQKLKKLTEIQSTFKKECKDLEDDHRAETSKLASQLDENMARLQQKLIAETKRKQLDNLRRSIFNAMQNDI